MKIFSADTIRAWDAYTIAHEPISSLDLMERASEAFVSALRPVFLKNKRVRVFCGTGNNGGDGLAVARMLRQENCEVEVYVVRFSDKTSPDFEANYQRLAQHVPIQEIRTPADLPALPFEGTLIDAIFGSGLHRPPEGLALAAIEHLNHALAQGAEELVAIDIASGLYADHPTPNIATHVAHPTRTISFETPKLAFMVPENALAVGEWGIAPIGLHPAFVAEQPTPFRWLAYAWRETLHKKRAKFAHKGTYGHALLMAGSYGKIGAAILAAKATLRAGVGLLTVRTPTCGYIPLQVAVPEAMCQPDVSPEVASTFSSLASYTALGIGPGWGQAALTGQLLSNLLTFFHGFPTLKLPRLLLDADALNLLASERRLLEYLPAGSVLTPHFKEFERLVGAPADSHFARLEQLRGFCQQYGVYVVLKGAHTAIGLPSGDVVFNESGNPGMATAGSGDVLTGVLLGLLAQSAYTVEEAVLLGVYLHGFAGDLATDKHSEESLIASDIIAHLGDAFRSMARYE